MPTTWSKAFVSNPLCRAVGYAARSAGCVGVLCCAAVAPPLLRVRLCSRVFWFAGTSKIMIFLILRSHLALLIEDVILFVISFSILPPSLADQIYYSSARLGPPHAPSAPVQKLFFISYRAGFCTHAFLPHCFRDLVAGWVALWRGWHDLVGHVVLGVLLPSCYGLDIFGKLVYTN